MSAIALGAGLFALSGLSSVPAVADDGGTAPLFTSASSATAITGDAFSFTVTTTGTPTASLTLSGSLPPTFAFTDDGDGTGTITGNPDYSDGFVGRYNPVTLTATSTAGTATQSFTISIEQPFAAITSGSSATAIVGSPFSFTVTTTGTPAPSLSISASLPDLSFTDNGDGTATIAGTPQDADVGQYPVTLTAINNPNPIYPPFVTNQSFTLAIEEPDAPLFTSTASATAITGDPFSFSVTTTGSPTAALSVSGTLPDTFTFTDDGDGTATITGDPPADANVGQYNPVTLTATNAQGTATQSLTLTVKPPLAQQMSHNPSSYTAADGDHFDEQFYAAGFVPFPTLTESGALPDGVYFVDNGSGVADLFGTTSDDGVYPITITAHDGIEPDVTVTFTLTVAPAAPIAFTSAPSLSVVWGTPFTFTVTTSGVPSVSHIHATFVGFNHSRFPPPPFPQGVTFNDNGDGTATISGTLDQQYLIPPYSSPSVQVELTAQDFNSDQATQTFTLTGIDPAPGCVAADCDSSVNTDPAGSAQADSGGTSGVTATASGVGGLTVGQYTGNPVSIPAVGATGAYFDVAVSQDNAFTSLAIDDCDLMGGNVVQWWNPNQNGGEWEPVSNQTFVAGSPNCVAIDVGPTSTPSLGELVGTIFAVINQVPTPPAFTSAATTTATIGQASSFTLTTSGYPTAALTYTGTLPSGMSLVDNGDGTAALSGTPAAGTAKTYVLKVTAKNSAGSVLQTFSLVVSH